MSSRVFPDAAPRAALNAAHSSSERCRDSDLYVAQNSSSPGSASPGSPCDVRACSAPGQAQRRCQTVAGTVPFRRARGHALWQEQRHRTMVDAARCPGTGELAKPTWPHALCASPAHARDVPGAVPPAPAPDTTSPPEAYYLRAAHVPLLGVYFGSTRRLDLPFFRRGCHAGRLLLGFVNVAWDGSDHAVLLDTKVRSDYQRRGIATEAVSVAVTHSRAAGCEWLHVDFEEHLAPFYFDACGFRPTPAEVIYLPRQNPDD
jgi:ribosomal protein S18 acetylase RimI-like enzyme